jgi:replicative DNA helicase
MDMPGGRHNAAMRGALALLRLLALEHPGADVALTELGARFRTAIGDRSSPGQAEKEWSDLVQGAVAIVRETPSEAPMWEPSTPRPDMVEWWDVGKDVPEDEPTVHVRSRIVTGGTFALDIPDITPAIWGADSEVLWAEGESMLIVGPPGVGKTTITHQIVLARLGLLETVLGWPVKPAVGKLLYLACDRPAQIARSLHRMVSEEHRELLDDRLVIWRGPPPKDFAKDPLTLTKMAQDEGADTVFIDSLKDVALGLVDDDVGAGYNRARQHALAEGIDLAELHHQRKGQGGVKPKALEDVYGSIWLTAGAGSVLLIWGQGGDPLVELIHLKQPADQIQQPVSVSHDHDRGVSTLVGAVDILTMIRNAGAGFTAPQVARLMYEKTPTKAETEKVRRKLDWFVKDGRIDKEDATYRRNERT